MASNLSARARLGLRVLLAIVLAGTTLLAVASPGATDSGEAAVAAAVRYQRIASLGAQHSCAVTDAGGVECWGDNQFGQLGTGDTTGSTTPRVVNGITGALEVAAGNGHTCVLVHGGSVSCWGLDASGQLGNGDPLLANRTSPVPVLGLTDAVHLAAGDFHTCATRTDGTVWCWGQDGMGQLGDGSPGDFSTVPVKVTGIPSGQTALDLTAGQWHTCARTEDAAHVDRLLCWGHNGFGQLGDDTTTDRSQAVPVLDPDDVGQQMTGVLAQSAGAGHTCAILDRVGRPVFCWGQNSYGQLGHKTADDPASPSGLDPALMVPSKRPLRVQRDANADPLVDDPQDLADARTVSAGSYHSCVTQDGGAVQCWGQNGEGQLGFDPRPLTPDTYETTYLARPAGGTGVGVVAGGLHTCVVKVGGMQCWGYDFFGQLGGYRDQVPSPTTVTALRGATRIAVGTHVACVLRSDLPADPPGTSSPVKPFCWGSNADGRLGIGTLAPTSSDLPLPVGLGGDDAATEVRAGNGTVCALPAAAARRCWGRNQDGELGDGSTIGRPAPTASTHLAGVTSYDLGGGFASGAEHGTTCRVTGGQAQCWGWNGSGQLGDGTTTSSTAPVTVRYDDDADDSTPMVPLTGATAVAVGGDHACALLGSGRVRCWGANGAGQLGDNTTDARPGAVLVQQDTDPDADDPLSGVTAIDAGRSHTCALLSSGKVRCWGDATSGKLGRAGSGKQADLPVRWQPPLPAAVGDLDGVTRLVLGDDHACALRSDMSLVCWGDNSRDQVGTGGASVSPGQVVLKKPTSSPLPGAWIQDVAAGRDNTCAVLLDTTVSCWGDNSEGQVGDGIGTRSLAPVTVGGAASIGANLVPEPPVLTATTTPGTPVDVTVPLAGMDPDGSPSPTTLVGVADPPLGSASTSTASIHYVPDAGCHDDSFAYTVSDGAAVVSGKVRVLMNCAPVAVPDTVSVGEDSPTDVDVLANDTDEDGDVLTVSSVPARSAHAALSIVSGKVRFSPDADYCGPDSFGYAISDGQGHTASTTVAVTVSCGQDPPAPGTDAVSTPEDVPVTISVLANDTDPDGDPLTLVDVGTPAHGTATVVGSSVRYAPAADYDGPDTFTYRVSDGHTTSTGTVNVSVTAVGDSPQPRSDSATTAEDTSVDVPVLANDTDPDGDSLTLTPVFGAPQHGTATQAGGSVRYTPAADYCGPDQLTYTVSDGSTTATALLTLSVTCVNDAPVARADAVSTPEDTTVHAHVLTNDSDVDGNPLTVDRAGAAVPPQHGTLAVSGTSVDYTPARDWCGNDSFSYDAVDPGGLRSSALVSVGVTCVDDPVSLAPVADQTTAWGSPVSVALSPSDPDGPATLSLVSGPGAVASGAWSWTPASSDVGTRTVTVRASQGGASADRSFAVTVQRRATSLAYTGASAGQLSDQAVVAATLQDAVTHEPVPGVQVTFALAPATVGAPTTSSGQTSTTVPVAGPVGARTLAVSFAGSSAWAPSSTTAAFTVQKESMTVAFAGTPLVLTGTASPTLTLTADLAEQADGSLGNALAGTTVTFRRLSGTTLCTASASGTSVGNARASCTATGLTGAVPVLVTATSSSYAGPGDVGVQTVAPTGAGTAAGAGRVGSVASGDDFGFAAQPAKKGGPTGSLAHVVSNGGTATVVAATSLSSLSTTCSSSKVCKATIGATAQVSTVDLTTGLVTPAGSASVTQWPVEPNRYAVSVSGGLTRTLGSAATPVLIDFGSIEIG